MIGDIPKEGKVSTYAPSKEVADFTHAVKKDYETGWEILHRPWPELNDHSVIEDENHGKRMFNAFVDENIEDPAEAWKWRGTRSMARNKAIAVHANLTSSYLIPMFSAQNEDDEVDEDFSDFMRDLVEWMTVNSDYRPAFMSVTVGMMTNPVTYLGAEFAEVYQTVKEKQSDGTITKKEVLDEVLSGFQAPVYGPSQILITNAYQRNIQKQRAILKRRYIEFAEAQAVYGEHPHWGYVMAGVKSIYNEDDGLFYEITDDEHPSMVEEVTYLNRRDDTEVCFINGIYMGAPSVDANPIKHRDNKGAPKYNVVPFGYHRIGEHFFYYKSMMNALKWDNQLIDAMYETGMNKEFLQLNMPVAVSGQDKIDSDVVFPGAVLAFADKDTKVTPLLPMANTGQFFNTMQLVEQSMSEGSISDTAAGQLPEASQKAYSVAQAANASKKLLSAIGKSLGESITMYGDLMKDIVINHLSVPQVMDIIGEQSRLKYKTFVLPGKSIGGKQVNKQLSFDESLIGQTYTEEEVRDKNLKLLEETGYPDHKKHLYVANPEQFAKFKYLSRCDPEEMFPKNEEMMQALVTNLYQITQQDPFVEHEAMTHELMSSYFKGRADKFIAKQPQNGLGAPAMPPAPGAPGQLGPMAQNKQLSTAVAPTLPGVK